ncbi:translation initiation factor IF-2, partial [Ehrlichia ruminantium]
MNESKSVASNELTSGKVERTTLKLSDKLKISSNIQQGNKFSLNKSITTVEVRKSKKRKNIDEAARSSLLLQNNDIDGNSEDKNSLTIQEQISRMNALQNASNNEKREELSSDSNKHTEKEVISVKAEVEPVDVVLPNDNLLTESDNSEKVIVDPVTDSEHGDKDIQDVVMLD